MVEYSIYQAQGCGSARSLAVSVARGPRIRNSRDATERKDDEGAAGWSCGWLVVHVVRERVEERAHGEERDTDMYDHMSETCGPT